MNTLILETLRKALGAFRNYCGGLITYDETFRILRECIADVTFVNRRTRNKEEKTAFEIVEICFYFRLFELFKGGATVYGSNTCVLRRAAQAIKETEQGLRRRFPELSENRELTAQLSAILQ